MVVNVRSVLEEEAWQAARKVVLSRDGFKCVKCGTQGSLREPLHVHHLFPRSGGGADAPANLVSLCNACHAARHMNMLGSLARRVIERWAVKLARLLASNLPAELDRLGLGLRAIGAQRLRDGQLEIVLAALRGQSVLAVLPTGYGKSLCFQLPAILSDGCSFVVTPTKALMSDQVQALYEKQVPALFINGDLSPREKGIRYQLLEQDALKLLYVAPERFNPSMVRDRSEIERLLSRRPAFLVIDEAHKIDSWGDAFRPDYSRLGEVRQRLGNPPVLAFTATAGSEMQDRILASLGAPDATRFVRGVDRPNIAFARLQEPDTLERARIIAFLHQRLGGRAMVFVPTVRHGTEAAEALRQAGIEAPLYHGQLRPNERELILARFDGRNEPAARIVVCTNAFGMGIDLPDVRLVAHWAHPASIEDYIQEAGRAGRDGLPALAVLFHSRQDAGLQRFMAEKSVESSERMEADRTAVLRRKLKNIEEMVGLAETRSCVRREVVRYFGEGTVTKRGLLYWLLEKVFAVPRRNRRATFCCDACQPRWLAQLGYARTVA